MSGLGALFVFDRFVDQGILVDALQKVVESILGIHANVVLAWQRLNPKAPTYLALLGTP